MLSLGQDRYNAKLPKSIKDHFVTSYQRQFERYSYTILLIELPVFAAAMVHELLEKYPKHDDCSTSSTKLGKSIVWPAHASDMI